MHKAEQRRHNLLLGTSRLLPAGLLVAAQQAFFPMPAGVFVRGVIVGGVTALVALGMALVHRSNRFVNIAQADLGSAPMILTILLLQTWGWPYPVAVVCGVVSALVLGMVVEAGVIRRFRHASRLVVTVASIGVAQVLAGLAVLLPRMFGATLIAPRVADPFDMNLTIGTTILRSNSLVALLVAPLLMVAVVVFLQRSMYGTAIRAAADRADRVSMLGVSVGRLHTVVWAIAGLLSFAALFLRAGIVGVAIGPALGLGLLLRSLTAMVLGRMSDLVIIVSSATALGVLELGVLWNDSQVRGLDTLLGRGVSFEVILGVVVLVALLTQRGSTGRQGADETSTWRAVDDVRPLSAAVRALTPVRVARGLVIASITAVAMLTPHLVSVDRSLKASAVLVYAALGLSFVVLTGWAGQVSLGQLGFFAIGSAVGAKLTITWNVDLLLAIPLAGLVGALAAVLVGLPALRLRGLQLAVSTLAFGLVTSSWLLDRAFFEWVPNTRVERKPLLGRIEITSATEIYYVCLGVLVALVIGMRGLRNSRTGRVLIALRDNERAAQSYGVSATTAKLTAFAISGFVASCAGALFAHHQQAFDPSQYDAAGNLAVFAVAVVGGVGSVLGVVIGAIWFRGLGWFLPTEWQVVASGIGAVGVLLVLPGGLASLVWKVRDAFAQWAVDRSGTAHLPDPIDPAVGVAPVATTVGQT